MIDKGEFERIPLHPASVLDIKSRECALYGFAKYVNNYHFDPEIRVEVILKEERKQNESLPKLSKSNQTLGYDPNIVPHATN